MNSFESFNQLVLTDKTLPQSTNEILLRRFFKVCENDSEKALALYKEYLSQRKKCPQVCLNRDVIMDDIQTALTYLQFFPLPKMTKDNRRVFYLRYTTRDTSGFNGIEVLRMMIAAMDARYVLDDEGSNLSSDDIIVMDSSSTAIKHLLEFCRNIKSNIFFMKYIQTAVPLPTKECHILGVTWLTEKVMASIRPFLSKAVAERTHMHRNGFEKLHKFVPKEVLPFECGGDLGPVDELFKDWLKIFISKREYLLNDDNFKILE